MPQPPFQNRQRIPLQLACSLLLLGIDGIHIYVEDRLMAKAISYNNRGQDCQWCMPVLDTKDECRCWLPMLSPNAKCPGGMPMMNVNLQRRYSPRAHLSYSCSVGPKPQSLCVMVQLIRRCAGSGANTTSSLESRVQGRLQLVKTSKLFLGALLYFPGGWPTLPTWRNESEKTPPY